MVQQVKDADTGEVSLKWIAREYDGHGLLTFDQEGEVVGPSCSARTACRLPNVPRTPAWR